MGNAYWNEGGLYRVFEGIKAVYLSNSRNASYVQMTSKMNFFQMLHKIWNHPPNKQKSKLIAAISAVECMQQATMASSAPGEKSREVVLIASKGFTCPADFASLGIQAMLDPLNTSSTMLSLVNLYIFMFITVFPYNAANSLMREYVLQRTLGQQDPQITQEKWQWNPDMFTNANMVSAQRFNYVYIDQLFPRGHGESVSFELGFKETVLMSAYRSTLAGLLGVLKDDLEYVKVVEAKILGSLMTILFTLVSYVMNAFIGRA